MVKMESERVQIQIKRVKGDKTKSKAMTIYGADMNEVFNRVLSMFEALEQTDKKVKIICYKRQERKKMTKYKIVLKQTLASGFNSISQAEDWVSRQYIIEDEDQHYEIEEMKIRKV